MKEASKRSILRWIHLVLGGRDKDVAALTDLYTSDALVLDPVTPSWFRCERAVNYVIRGTVINNVAELELVLRGRNELLKKAATLIRRIGLRRILWGSDGPKFADAPSRESWTKFRTTVPLSQRELRTIAGNLAPYIR